MSNEYLKEIKLSFFDEHYENVKLFKNAAHVRLSVYFDVNVNVDNYHVQFSLPVHRVDVADMLDKLKEFILYEGE